MSNYGTAIVGQDEYGSGAAHPYSVLPGRLVWALEVDWNNDGVFEGLETRAISRVEIRRGRGQRIRADGRGQIQAGDESFLIEVRDPSGRYDAFNQSSPLFNSLGAPGLLLRLRVKLGAGRAASEAVFTGTLTRLRCDPERQSARLEGSGLAQRLELGEAAALHAGCQSFSLDAYESYFHWDGSTPCPFNYWKGRPGGLSLLECVKIVLGKAGWPLGLNPGGASGLEGPAYFFLDGRSAWQTLLDLADGFAARLFFSRDGSLLLMERQDAVGLAAALPAPARTLERSPLEREPCFDSLRNRVEVSLRSFEVPLFNSPLPPEAFSEAWSNAGPIEVAPASTLEIEILYPVRLGQAQQGGLPAVNSDAMLGSVYEVWSRADQSGINMGYSGTGEGEFGVIYEVVDATGWGFVNRPQGNDQRRCRVFLQNWSGSNTAYFFNLKLLLIGVRETGSPLEYTLEDSASIALNGRRALRIDNRWVQNMAQAEGTAQTYLAALSSREGASLASLTYLWSGQELFQNLKQYEPGAHVDFGVYGEAGSEAGRGMSGRWLIVAQELRWLSPDGQAARVKLTYERVSSV